MNFVAKPVYGQVRSSSATRGRPAVVSAARPGSAPRSSSLTRMPELSARHSTVQAGSALRASIMRPQSAQREAVVRVTSDFILKGAGQIKLAPGESVVLGRDPDDADFIVRSNNGERWPKTTRTCVIK